MEIKQNSALVRAQPVDSNFSGQQAQAMARVGDDSANVCARIVEDPDNLTLADVQVIEAELRARLLRLRRNAVMQELGVYTGRWRQDHEWFSRPFTTPVGRTFWSYWYENSADWMRDMLTFIDKSAPTVDSDDINMLRESADPQHE